MEKKELIDKNSTDFVAHNMLMNYWLWDDNQLLIESFIKNNEIDIHFNINHFHFCISGVDSKYSNYTESKTFNLDIGRTLREYEDIYKMLRAYNYDGNCFLIKPDNSKKVAVIFSETGKALCPPITIAAKIHALISSDLWYAENIPVATSLAVDYSGYESIHKAYKEAHRLNQLAFFGIQADVITQELVSKITIECALTLIDENCRKLKYLCCTAAIEEILHQVDIIFNQLVRSSLSPECFNTAFTLCEMNVLLFQKVYHLSDVPAAKRQKDYDSLNDYILDLSQRLTMIIERITKQPRYSFNVLLAMSYIMDHYTQDISLKVISEYANVNPTSLSTDFNREVSVSISEFISNLRINKAKELLLTNMEIPDIMEASGFTSIRYFTNMFKKATKMTPLAYRKARQNDMIL